MGLSNADIYTKVTERVVEAMRNGIVPWHQPWRSTYGSGLMPRSIATGKAYRGVNVWLLGITQQLAGYQAPWWGTYKQITEQGGQIRKGEKSTFVVLWKPMKKVDAEGQEKSFFMLRYFNVFNIEQADWVNGLPKRFAKQAPVEELDFEPVIEAERVVGAYFAAGGPRLHHGGDGAYYAPAIDTVRLPYPEQFESGEKYYGALFHELGHSTGASTRLNREGITNIDRFGSHQYAAEELIAEMSAAMLSAVCGIELQVEHHAAYIDHWMQTLQKDHKLLMQAASAAQKASDWILGQRPGSEVESTDDDKELVTA